MIRHITIISLALLCALLTFGGVSPACASESAPSSFVQGSEEASASSGESTEDLESPQVPDISEIAKWLKIAVFLIIAVMCVWLIGGKS